MSNAATGTDSGQPRRRAILSIDGGGIRGALTLQILKRLEQELRALPGKHNTTLADHFDLIAGTSVGGILASLIALGKPTDEIIDLISKRSDVFFEPSRNPWKKHLFHRFAKGRLADLIRRTVGENATLGDPAFRTRLLLIMRNASTDSPWIVSNCPEAPFNRPELEDCNLQLPLWQLILASAAAPTFFAPEVVQIGPRRFAFVDGALTGFNNPAFKAFQFATTGAYGLSWPADEQSLSLVSVGTGSLRQLNQEMKWVGLSKLGVAMELPMVQIAAADRETDILCRTFGRCHLGDWIDHEVGDLRDVPTALSGRLFSYYRINVDLNPRRLAELKVDGIDTTRIMQIDAVRNLDALARIGKALADEVFARGLPVREMARSA